MDMKSLLVLALAAVVAGVIAATGSAAPATPSRCVTAWDATAPSAQRTMLENGHIVAKAFVAAGHSSLCEFFFTQGNGQLVLAQGTLKAASVATWKPLVRLTKSASTVPSNASVRANGTLALRG